MPKDKKVEEEVKPNEFTALVPPPNKEVIDKINKNFEQQRKAEVRQETLDTTVLSAQEKVVKGLTEKMTDFQLNNMKKLAPLDEFEIPLGSGHIYKRRKMKPSMIRELKKVEREYAEDIKKIEDPDLRLDRDWQFLAFKANLYLGMTPDEFEETDIEYLQVVIQATELRSQGFREF